jgi:hypothetical protein
VGQPHRPSLFCSKIGTRMSFFIWAFSCFEADRFPDVRKHLEGGTRMGRHPIPSPLIPRLAGLIGVADDGAGLPLEILTDHQSCGLGLTFPSVQG